MATVDIDSSLAPPESAGENNNEYRTHHDADAQPPPSDAKPLVVSAADRTARRDTQRKMSHPPTSTTPHRPITEADLSPLQLAKLSELRLALGEALLARTPFFNDTFSLLRWLNGYHYRVREIVPKLEQAAEIIRCMGLMDASAIEDLDELNAHLNTVTLATPYFPGGVMSIDNDGNVVMLQCLGKCRPKALAHCGRISDIYRLTITETAYVYKLIKAQEARRGHKCWLRVIVDLEGFSTEHLFTSTLRTYANVLRNLQSMFPDLAKQVYIINAPVMVTVAWTVVKAVLSEESRQKVVFLGSDYASHLGRELGEENLLTAWGGKLQPMRGDMKTGMLRVGAVPPAALRYLPSKNVLHPTDAKQLKKLFVPTKQKREKIVTIDRPNATLSWFFTTSSDIEFGILRLKTAASPQAKLKHGADRELVWPLLVVNTDFVPEFGQLRGLDVGDYLLVFDNTATSTIFGREIKYRVTVNHESSV